MFQKKSTVNQASLEIKTTFFLLNARLLLILGYESSVQECLDQIALNKRLDANQKIELKYLQLYASVDPGNFLPTLNHYRSIIDTLIEQERESASYSYELEQLLFINILEPKKVKSRKKFIERCKFLARKSGDQTMFPLITNFESIIYHHNPTEADYLVAFESLHKLYKSSYHLLFQHLTIQIIDFLLMKSRYGKASSLLQDLKAYHANRESGISQKLLGQLKKSPSRIRNYYNKQIEQLPTKFDEDSEIQNLLPLTGEYSTLIEE
ncbi:MAG: hypothetical protein AB8G05_04625 [Oligoflexales bacterium]